MDYSNLQMHLLVVDFPSFVSEIASVMQAHVSEILLCIFVS